MTVLKQKEKEKENEEENEEAKEEKEKENRWLFRVCRSDEPERGAM